MEERRSQHAKTKEQHTQRSAIEHAPPGQAEEDDSREEQHIGLPEGIGATVSGQRKEVLHTYLSSFFPPLIQRIFLPNEISFIMEPEHISVLRVPIRDIPYWGAGTHRQNRVIPALHCPGIL